MAAIATPPAGTDTLTLLDYLRSQGTFVDCDTLSLPIAETLGPFQDCTSNQAIVWGELIDPITSKLKESYRSLVLASCKFADAELERFRSETRYPGLRWEELAVEVMTISLAHLIANSSALRPSSPASPPSHIHIQLNPHHSLSESLTLSTSFRISLLWKHLCPIQPFPSSSSSTTTSTCRPYPTLSVKIPCCHPAMRAAHILETDPEYNIRTLSTIVLSLPQVKLAEEAGCSYVAVYVNELGVHFEGEREKIMKLREEKQVQEGAGKGEGEGGLDPEVRKGMEVVRLGQRWLRKKGCKGLMMPASLTSPFECLRLAGAEHITISPPLLQSLSSVPWIPVDSTNASTSSPNTVLIDTSHTSAIPPSSVLLTHSTDEKIYAEMESTISGYLDSQVVFERDFGAVEGGEVKQRYLDAVRIFGEFQDKLEGLAREVGREVGREMGVVHVLG